MHPTLLFFTKIVYVLLAGVGIFGAALHLTMIVQWLQFPGAVWCTNLAGIAIFSTMAAVGVWKAKGFRWWYAIPLVALGVVLGGQMPGSGPACFGPPIIMSWNSI